MAAIGVIVGINLIMPATKAVTSPVTTTLANGQTTTTPATATGAVAGILNIIPIIFVAVIILGAVSWIAGEGHLPSFGHGEPNPVEDLKKKLIRISKNLNAYMNNLDIILGITTSSDTEAGRPYGLSLVANDEDTTGLFPCKLYVDENYHWFITDKNPDQPMFKIVGINKNNIDDCKVYVLGKNEATNKPYIFEIPKSHLESTDKYWIDLALTEEMQSIK